MTPQERADALERRISGHKLTIRRERDLLVRAAAELAAFKRECAVRGIKVVFKEAKGKDAHGRPDERAAS